MRIEDGKLNIGVLALQGGFIEHINQIEALGQNGILVKDKEDLNEIDGLILPGGESTVIGKLLELTGLKEPIKSLIKNGLPTLGTCAGMIILGKEIENEGSYLNLMNIKIKRNAYGRQMGSFKITGDFKGIFEKIEQIFIRAPYIEEILNKETVNILSIVNEKIVAVEEKNMIALSFHPELSNDLKIMNYFIKKIKDNLKL
ncbi:MAG: pyridoxal 5'-phosphate synthase glutaminase subunit PdxT [Sarcina sp.]